MGNSPSQDELLQALREVAEEVGRSPSQSDIREHGEWSVQCYYNHFDGGMQAAKEQAGLELYEQQGRDRVEVECAACGATLERTPSDVEKNDEIYCDYECMGEGYSDRYAGDGNPRSTLETVACANCGAEIQRAQWERERREYNFCDYDCYGEWREENVVGEEYPKWIEYPTLYCEYCERPFEVKPAVADSRRFCSKQCWYLWRSMNLVGPDNPDFNSIEKTCQTCGDEYYIKPSEAEQSKYCSYDCMHADAHPEGENHPRWNPDSEDLYYGPNWMEQRRKAIIWDQARCQNPKCDITEVAHIRRYGRGLDVHHQKPLESFASDGSINYECANALDNLVTLCRECHNKADSSSYQVKITGK